MLPQLETVVDDVSTAQSVMRFIAALEDNDDVQNVYSNMDMTEEVLAAISEDA